MNRELEFHADSLVGNPNLDEEAERTPINFLQLALRNKWFLLCGLGIGLALGHMVYLKAGPEFEAAAQIMVSRKYTPPMRESERMLQETGKPNEHIPIIMSPMIAERALKIGDLKTLPSFQKEPDVIDSILEGLKVKRIAGQDRSAFSILDVRYPSRNAQDAKKVVEAVIAGYKQYLQDQSSEHSTEVLNLAHKASADLAAKLEAKEKEYQEFLKTVPEEFRSALGPKTTVNAQQTNIAPEDVIQKLGDERNKNRIQMAELLSRRRNIEAALASGLPREGIEAEAKRYMTMNGRAEQTMINQEIAVYQSQLLPLVLREQDLSRHFGKDHPELLSVRRSIDKVVQTFQKMGLQLPDGIDSGKEGNSSGDRVDYVAMFQVSVDHQLAELELKDKELESLIKREGVRAQEFAVYRETDQHLTSERTAIHDLWTKRLDHEGSAAVEKDTNGYTLKVLSPVKEGLSIKRMMKFYSGGAIAGMLLVAGICLLRELRDLTLKDVKDIRTTLRQPILGSVVAYDMPTDPESLMGGAVHPGLRYLVAPHSVEAENYRSIRTAMIVMAERQSARVIMVSSPEPGDGKTTLVSNLAIALAQSGKRVLLIDSDLRRPNVNQLFRVNRDIGFVDVLKGDIEILNAVIVTTVPGLSLLPAGRVPGNPAEVLSSPRLGQVLRDVRDEYDFVFVDAPPLLAVSDPCILARHCDAVLIVSRLNKNTRTSAIRVREIIENQGIRVLGAVANGVVLGKNRGYEYYGEYIVNTHPAAPVLDSAAHS